MLLVIAIYNLLGRRVQISTQIKQSEELLDLFVKEIPSLYGNRELSYNIHQLLHLGLAVRRWGPLWATSAFPFEDQNGLIAKTVHGSRHLQQEIINNVKIAQGVRIMKNRNDCIKTNAGTVFEFLGKEKSFKTNSFQNDLFISDSIDVKKCLFYDRASIKNRIFTSSMYKITKTNNFTVNIKLVDDDRFAIINCFIKYDATCYILVQYINLISDQFKHTKTNSLVRHLIPFDVSNDFKIIKIDKILSITHVMQVGNYLCKVLNTYNTVI